MSFEHRQWQRDAQPLPLPQDVAQRLVPRGSFLGSIQASADVRLESPTPWDYRGELGAVKINVTAANFNLSTPKSTK